MNIVCLDFEGVLVPDIWPHVAQRSGVDDLKLTTRDVKDYTALMNRRVEICHTNGITLKQIQTWIAELNALDGALEFVSWIQERYQLILLSDTFYEFVPHFMAYFNYPALFCHSISYNESTGYIEFHLRQDNQKAQAVKALKALNFNIFASGDSYNDITMLQEANSACFFGAPDTVLTDFPEYDNLKTYDELRQKIELFFNGKE
ncbi:MAG: bifunctional phosphoserine phosphatase/homoserine phosphotransferase ThrH [Fibrobacteria bacterium]|nr:bifunctional phosphoserine phosphatase/homoserine phosphotransferase ThrH [Fibrobacteria bacterium]